MTYTKDKDAAILLRISVLGVTLTCSVDNQTANNKQEQYIKLFALVKAVCNSLIHL